MQIVCIWSWKRGHYMGVVVVVTSSFFEDGDKISQIIVLLH